jgi:hypothetical protein
MVGYRAWFYYAEKKADAALEARLDKDQYNENDLLTITVPLNNPYLLDQNKFERVSGEISIQGKTFKYVHRKVSNGNLIIQCIPDAPKMVLKKANAEYGNNANGLAGSKKSSSRNNVLKNFGGNDYIEQRADMQMCNCANENSIRSQLGITLLADVYIASPGKPPQFRA